MADRKRTPRNNKSAATENNVPAEVKDETMINDETLTGAPDENVNQENVNSEPDNSADTPPAENSADNSDNVEKGDKAPEKFDIPEDWSKLTLSDDFAEVIGKRLLKVLEQAVATNDLLKAQAAGDDSAAVIAYAEGDKSSDDVKAILSQYLEMKNSLDTLFGQLTSVVKTEKGDVQLTPKEVEEKKALHKQLIQSAKHAHVAYMDYARDNECGDDVNLFGKTIEGMIGGRSSAGAKAPSGNYKQSTSVRPRLGNNGYVKVGDTNYDSFTLAIKAINKLEGGKDINVGQLHTAWVNAALNSDELSKWTDIPKDVETNFTVGTEEKPINVAVMVA